MPRVLLITGSTGKQGGSVISALLERDADFTILAVTRNAKSANASKLAAKSSKIKLLQGNLNDATDLFATAKQLAVNPIWGVYSVQSVVGHEEVSQSKALIDESLKHGVEHFVYGSVDRGGDERSWQNPTPVPHFQTKYEIEHYLRDVAAGKMGWTILRPVAFMENLLQGFPARVFLTAMHDSMGEKRQQWVASSDIGFFAAEAFLNPGKWNNQAVGLAGDELSSSQVTDCFQRATGAPFGYTFSIFGSVLRWAIMEMSVMIDWFAAEGYGVNIGELRRINPNMKNLETFVREARGVGDSNPSRK